MSATPTDSTMIQATASDPAPSTEQVADLSVAVPSASSTERSRTPPPPLSYAVSPLSPILESPPLHPLSNEGPISIEGLSHAPSSNGDRFTSGYADAHSEHAEKEKDKEHLSEGEQEKKEEIEDDRNEKEQEKDRKSEKSGELQGDGDLDGSGGSRLNRSVNVRVNPSAAPTAAATTGVRGTMDITAIGSPANSVSPTSSSSSVFSFASLKKLIHVPSSSSSSSSSSTAGAVPSTTASSSVSSAQSSTASSTVPSSVSSPSLPSSTPSVKSPIPIKSSPSQEGSPPKLLVAATNKTPPPPSRGIPASTPSPNPSNAAPNPSPPSSSNNSKRSQLKSSQSFNNISPTAATQAASNATETHAGAAATATGSLFSPKQAASANKSFTFSSFRHMFSSMVDLNSSSSSTSDQVNSAGPKQAHHRVPSNPNASNLPVTPNSASSSSASSSSSSSSTSSASSFSSFFSSSSTASSTSTSSSGVNTSALSKDEQVKEMQKKEWLALLPPPSSITSPSSSQSISFSSNPKIKSKCTKLAWFGIPPSVRSDAWIFIIGNDLHLTEDLFIIMSGRAAEVREMRRKKEEELNKMRQSMQAESESDSATSDASSSFVSSTASSVNKEDSIALIDKDVSRTFPELKFFHDDGPLEGPLFQILETYACYRPDVGYVQGMSYLAAMLLLNMDTFYAFVGLANLLNQDMYFKFFRMNAGQMKLHLDVFQIFFKEQLPQLHAHLDKLDIRPDMYLYEWLLTIFSRSLQLDVNTLTRYQPFDTTLDLQSRRMCTHGCRCVGVECKVCVLYR